MPGGNGTTEHQNDRNEELLPRLERKWEFEEDKAWAILAEGET